MIRTEQLKKIYQKGKISIPALQEVDFEINEGEVFSIVGKSGSGKSTLLNLIGGLDRATEGHIFFENLDLATMGRNQLADHRRFSVGMVFQSFNLIHSRSALENVSLAMAFGGVGRKNRKLRARELLTMVGLSDRMEHKPDELSGGETQRVAIARAMANRPRVILADEPTGNLDSVTSMEIIGLLKDLNRDKGITIVMVTHDQEMAREVSSHMITLQDGKIVERK